jgi:hypothetical protein
MVRPEEVELSIRFNPRSPQTVTLEPLFGYVSDDPRPSLPSTPSVPLAMDLHVLVTHVEEKIFMFTAPLYEQAQRERRATQNIYVPKGYGQYLHARLRAQNFVYGKVPTFVTPTMTLLDYIIQDSFYSRIKPDWLFNPLLSLEELKQKLGFLPEPVAPNAEPSAGPDARRATDEAAKHGSNHGWERMAARMEERLNQSANEQPRSRRHHPGEESIPVNWYAIATDQFPVMDCREFLDMPIGTLAIYGCF